MLLFSILAATLQPQADGQFPERSPALIAACLRVAAAAGNVSDTDGETKFLCTGTAAEQLWAFLEEAKVAPWEQDTGVEGVWLSRDFPLGGCFKRLRMANGSAATSGLSCSIWIPRAGDAAK